MLLDPELRNIRRHAGKAKADSSGRSPAQHDRDRLLYSSAFRRLAEVTQVISPTAGYVFHNRLTHSLQVAQVGRRLSEKLVRRYPEELATSEGLDPDVVEAACLAHDLGHPPFGHIAEEQLNKLLENVGGFEGNAQSFRILTELAFHTENYRGLDLTRATLAGVLKYPWYRNENPSNLRKWGAYDSEKLDFEFARSLSAGNQLRTIEADLMDWADDVTYSVHDIEDFYRAGRMPVHLLAKKDAAERNGFFDNVFQRHKHEETFAKHRADFEEAFTSVMVSNFPLEEVYTGTAKQRAGLRVFSSNLITRYVDAVKLELLDNRCKVAIDPDLKAEVAMLKELVWTYVIEAPALASQQYGQRRIIRELFGIFTQAASSPKDQRIFPAFYRERLQQAVSDQAEADLWRPFGRDDRESRLCAFTID